MQLEQELAECSLDRESLITIGVFDGVHLGHKNLIARLKELAHRQNLLSVVITFSQHPQQILTPDFHPPFLTDVGEKVALLQGEEVDKVIALTFTRELSQLSARDFVILLQRYLHMKGLIIGPDFVMGKNNQGNVSSLSKIGEELDFKVTAIPPVRINGDIVSSTAIRQALSAGDMEKVERLMGRPFSLHGHVIHGKGRGKILGTPTINLDILPGQALPSDGVYASLATIEKKNFASVTNVGKDPTFGENERTIETYLLDFQDNLYGYEVKIEFIHKIRAEIKFENVDDLKKQMNCDIATVRSLLDFSFRTNH